MNAALYNPTATKKEKVRVCIFFITYSRYGDCIENSSEKTTIGLYIFSLLIQAITKVTSKHRN